MNWQAISALMTGILSIGAAANYFMLQSIRLEITNLKSELKEWARETFASHDRVVALEVRVAELERR